MNRILTGLLISCCVSCLNSALADQETVDNRHQKQHSESDLRLPPVIPGETIKTKQGDAIKVWSSAGPVPIVIAPGNQQNNIGIPGGVIVDGRGLGLNRGLNNGQPRED